MTITDNTIQADGLSDFFKNLGKKGFDVSKKMAENVLRNPGPALDLTANFASAVAFRNTKAFISTLPEVINFYKTACLLFLGNFEKLCNINGTKNG